MGIKQKINLKEVTSGYYICNLIKSGEQLKMVFDNIEIIFENYQIFKCGYPNEEVYMHSDFYINNNPQKYILYEVEQSDWIRELVNVNKVHQRHSDILFETDKHFIIYYEDEIFECVAEGFNIIPKR